MLFNQQYTHARSASSRRLINDNRVAARDFEKLELRTLERDQEDDDDGDEQRFTHREMKIYVHGGVELINRLLQ